MRRDTGAFDADVQGDSRRPWDSSRLSAGDQVTCEPDSFAPGCDQRASSHEASHRAISTQLGRAPFFAGFHLESSKLCCSVCDFGWVRGPAKSRGGVRAAHEPRLQPGRAPMRLVAGGVGTAQLHTLSILANDQRQQQWQRTSLEGSLAVLLCAYLPSESHRLVSRCCLVCVSESSVVLVSGMPRHRKRSKTLDERPVHAAHSRFQLEPLCRTSQVVVAAPPRQLQKSP